MMKKAKVYIQTLFIGVAVSFMTLSSAFALAPAQKTLFQAGISNWDIIDDAICSAATTANGGDIYAVGDSLTVGMRDFGEFKTKLEAADWNVLKIEATSGDTVQQGLDKATADKETVSKAGTIVVALGTNGRIGAPEQLSASITSMIEGLRKDDMAPDAKIYWLNLYDKEDNYQNYNEALVSQAAALNFEIIDFAKEVNANPAGYEFAGDGVHMTGAGYTAKSQFAVDSLGSPGSSTTSEETNDDSVLGDKNTGWDGESQIWTEEELEKVETNKPFYIKAADEADIPWQLIAVIHRNESGLGRTNPGNGQGIYQFLNADGGPYPAGEVDDAEFQRQTNFMAKRLQEDFVNRNHSANAGPLKKTGTADNVIQDTLYSYNGRGGYDSQAEALGFTGEGEGFHGSPYVMNRADQPRDPTVEPTKSNGTWGQVKRDHGPIEYPANTHWGGWVLYAALAGIDGGGGSCSPDSVDGSVNADGYAFPVEPQTKKGNGGGYFSDLPCPDTNCHTHTDFVAFDIGRDPFATSTGAAVYAIYDGKVTGLSIFETYDGCYEFTLVADDGASYYYTHTSDVAVQEGQDVKAGDKLAQIGPQPCVDGGANPSAHQAHLHIQQIKNGTISPDLTPLMNEIFNGLPEE